MADNTETDEAPLKHLPTGRIERRLHMTRAGIVSGSKMAADMYGGWWSGVWSTAEQRQQRRSEKRREQAAYLVTEMGKLKGSVVKIGQMLALYGEHILPAEVCQALHRFEDSNTPLDWSLLEPVLAEQWREGQGEFFDISTTALAAASLGQVHRALFKPDEQEVCLKIQYPGIADSIDDDIADVGRLFSLARMFSGAEGQAELLGDIAAMLHAEVDYLREADQTELFSGYLADNEKFIIPRVYRQFCTSKLLVTSYEQGLPPLDAPVLALSQERRNRICIAYLELFFKEIFLWGKMQADPNFGNYRIRIDEDGDQLVLLDFGAIEEFPEEFTSGLKTLVHAAYTADLDAVICSAAELKLFPSSLAESSQTAFAEILVMMLEPFNHTLFNREGACSEGSAYRWKSSQLPKRCAALALKSSLSRQFSLPAKEFIFLQKKLLGVYTFISVLDGCFDARDILEEYL